MHFECTGFCDVMFFCLLTRIVVWPEAKFIIVLHTLLAYCITHQISLHIAEVAFDNNQKVSTYCVTLALKNYNSVICYHNNIFNAGMLFHKGIRVFYRCTTLLLKLLFCF